MTNPQSSPGLLPDEMLHAIGRVAAWWARLEYLMDDMIRKALDSPGAPEMDTALILPFAKRRELLSDLLKIFILDDPMHKDDSAAVHELLTGLAHLHHQRDLVVHGSVANSEQERKGELVYWFRRIRWDRPVRLLDRRAMTVARVQRIGDEISDLVQVAMVVEMILWASTHPSRRKGG